MFSFSMYDVRCTVYDAPLCEYTLYDGAFFFIVSVHIRAFCEMPFDLSMINRPLFSSLSPGRMNDQSIL